MKDELVKEFDKFLVVAQSKGYSLKTVMGWLRQRILSGNEYCSEIVSDRAIKYVENLTGTCPADIESYTNIDCHNLCETEGRSAFDCSKCWKDYFADNNNLDIGE